MANSGKIVANSGKIVVNSGKIVVNSGKNNGHQWQISGPLNEDQGPGSRPSIKLG